MFNQPKAVIYCRVSSVKQVTEGNGLASQETRCREYAQHKGYEVVSVFNDEGLSGKGMGGKYPYYLCPKKGCDSYRKSIRRDKVEGEFEKILEGMRPSPPLFFAAAEIFTDLWNQKRESSTQGVKTLQREIMLMERKSDQFMDRIIETDSPALITAYEGKIKKLESDKVRLSEQIANCGRPLESFDQTFRTALEFLSNPQILWRSGNLEHQRIVLKLAFAEKLAYHRNEGFRTAQKSQPFLLLEQISTPNKEMARIDSKTSNSLFDTLSQWEFILKRVSMDKQNSSEDVAA